MNRKMGIDYGSKRIGIAISDPLGITARGIETISWDGVKQEYAINRIKELSVQYDVDLVIVGLPKRTDGKFSESEENAKSLANLLEEIIDAKVIMRDERYTTVIANRIMRETNLKNSKKKGIVDQIAAEILLQDYLNHCIK